MTPTPLEVSINYTNDQHKPSFDIQSFTLEILALKGVKTGCCDITILSNKEIHKMNKTYLSHDYPTDVISFNLSDTPYHSDIYISYETAESQAIEEKHSLEIELKTLIIHGILHTLGYDDQTQEKKRVMFQEQDLLLKKHNLEHNETI